VYDIVSCITDQSVPFAPLYILTLLEFCAAWKNVGSMCWPMRCIIVIDMVDSVRNEERIVRPSHEPVLATLSSSLIFHCHSITPSQLPTIEKGPDTHDTTEGGPNIEAEHGATVGEGKSGIAVDDVSDFLACL